MVVVAGLSGESYDVDSEPFYAAGSRSMQYLCRDPRGQQRLYKQYRTPVTAPDAIERARQVMLFGRQTVVAAETGGATGNAAEAVNWPIDLVMHDGMVAGTVLPLIPMDYLQPDGRPRTLDQLWATPGQAGSYFRAGLAIRVCDIVRVLEDRQLVHGDLSAKNVLWQAAAPLVYLIDTAGLTAVDAAYDRFKDRYDLAVLVYRTLLPDAGGAAAPGAPWRPSGVPADLDPRVRTLFDRAFGNGGFRPDARPSALEWSDALRAVYLTPDGANYVPEALAVLDRLAAQRPASAPATPTVAFGPATAPAAPTGWSTPQQPAVYPVGPQSDSSNTALKVILGVLLVVLVIAIAVGAVVLTGKDSSKNSASGTSTTTTTTTTAPPTTTATFDKTTLNQQATDKTPFTADALLPQTFTDTKGVVFNRRSSGAKDCIASNMSQNVKTALQTNKCQQMMTGVYIDQSEKILTSLEVFAFPSNSEAETIYHGLEGQNQTWDVWCPTQGVGSSVCQANLDTMFNATYSSWGRQQYRYLYESYSLYINLAVDASLEPNLEAPARTVLQLVGPDNYWKTR
ncbi:phosphotransferase [Nocardia aurantiaca]|uniref:Phosphotransferase n=1 Tax=Nocardia aurantiaca TaxID=2675850 RepID=A0A6I3KXQ8_9NOCA|nr:phosphotransferase [Nocardia aurantiaca]MTE12884.1 phosphotransferase [Nocardia aurantiaca]